MLLLSLGCSTLWLRGSGGIRSFPSVLAVVSCSLQLGVLQKRLLVAPHLRLQHTLAERLGSLHFALWAPAFRNPHLPVSDYDVAVILIALTILADVVMLFAF